MRHLLTLTCAFGLAACTPGADTSALSVPAALPQTVTIDVNLTLDAPQATPYGTAGGYRPAITTVGLGAGLRFVNSDGFAHTATSLAGSSFPAASPLGAAALTQSGTLLSQGWSTGALQAGAPSQTLIADMRGTYLYGCFFHYGSPMRAAIVVQ